MIFKLFQMSFDEEGKSNVEYKNRLRYREKRRTCRIECRKISAFILFACAVLLALTGNWANGFGKSRTRRQAETEFTPEWRNKDFGKKSQFYEIFWKPGKFYSNYHNCNLEFSGIREYVGAKFPEFVKMKFCKILRKINFFLKIPIKIKIHRKS